MACLSPCHRCLLPVFLLPTGRPLPAKLLVADDDGDEAYEDNDTVVPKSVL